MQTDFLIVGQGIAGTWLSYYLQKEGYSCVVVDEWKETTASRVAAGMINPVTGRKVVRTWLIEELLPFAEAAYHEIGQLLQVTAIDRKDIIDFYPTVQMKLAFEKAVPEESDYLSLPENENDWLSAFQYELGYGKIQPAYVVFLQHLLPAWRNHLQQRSTLRNEKLELADLLVQPDHVRYQDITASKIIFCDGVESYQNPWFRNLPFAQNKGEIIWIEVDGLPNQHIFKKGITLSPWNGNVFWAGPSYEWNFEHDQPTAAFREKTEMILKNWLKLPFKTVDHKASLRPATVERRPFVGLHPLHPSIGIFNGMGTKGCSLSPYFANQFVQHLKNGTAITPEADIKRFTRVLSR